MLKRIFDVPICQIGSADTPTIISFMCDSKLPAELDRVTALVLVPMGKEEPLSSVLLPLQKEGV